MHATVRLTTTLLQQGMKRSRKGKRYRPTTTPPRAQIDWADHETFRAFAPGVFVKGWGSHHDPRTRSFNCEAHVSLLAKVNPVLARVHMCACVHVLLASV